MRILSVIVLAILVSACQMPSEQVVISDSSAGLSFRVMADKRAVYDIYVDGLLMGQAREFKEGEAILKVLPGSHVIKVISNGQVVMEEKVYVASGANKVLVVK